MAEPLHWSTVALVVLPVGSHRVGAPLGDTPPAPEPLHWLTVTSATAVPAGTVLLTVTVQITSLPPAKMPLHWLTPVTSWPDVLVVV